MTSGCFIDNVLATGAKEGYSFAATEGTPVNGVNMTYTTLGSPVEPDGYAFVLQRPDRRDLLPERRTGLHHRDRQRTAVKFDPSSERTERADS